MTPNVFRPNVLLFLNYKLSSPACKPSSSHKNIEGFNNPRNDIIRGSTEPADKLSILLGGIMESNLSRIPANP